MKKALAVLAGLAVVAGVVHVWRYGDPLRGFDFVTFYAAATLATTDQCPAVYDRYPGDESRIPPDGPLARAAKEVGYPTTPGQFYNLPICLLLFQPLVRFSYPDAYRLVNALNVAAVILTAWLSVQAAAPRARLQHRWLGFACLCVVAFVSHPVSYNTAIGNISPLLTLGYVLAFFLDRRGRPWAAGIALGVSIIFKPSPLPLVLFFVLRRRWRTAAGAAATIIGLVLIGLAYYGVSMHMRWLELMRYYSDRTFAAWNDQSLLAGLLRFSVADQQIITWKIAVAPQWTLWTQRMVLLLAFVWWLGACRRWQSTPRAAHGYGAGLLLVSVASPFAWTHYFVVALWPLAIVAADVLAGPNEDRLSRLCLLVSITAAWMANPQTVFELADHLRGLPVAGSWVGRCLVSNTLAAGIALFIWLQVLVRRGRSGGK